LDTIVKLKRIETIDRIDDFGKRSMKKTKLEIQKQNAIFSLIKKCHAAMKSARIFV